MDVRSSADYYAAHTNDDAYSGQVHPESQTFRDIEQGKLLTGRLSAPNTQLHPLPAALPTARASWQC